MYYFRIKCTQANSDELSDYLYSDVLDNGEECTVFMGKDKHENEKLLKHSLPRYIWFHVDNFSSAHLYLQLSPTQQLAKFEELTLNEYLLQQIGQLTKANSIKGNKANHVNIIYTPVNNLRTDGTMDVGTVAFINPKKVRRIHVSKREGSILNRINKTKYEISTDEFIKQETESQRKLMLEKKEKDRKRQQESRELQKMYEEQRKKNVDPYADFFTEENQQESSNECRKENWVEEDFW